MRPPPRPPHPPPPPSQDGQLITVPAVSNRSVVDFGQRVGKRETYIYNLPEARARSTSPRLPSRRFAEPALPPRGMPGHGVTCSERPCRHQQGHSHVHASQRLLCVSSPQVESAFEVLGVPNIVARFGAAARRRRFPRRTKRTHSLAPAVAFERWISQDVRLRLAAPGRAGTDPGVFNTAMELMARALPKEQLQRRAAALLPATPHTTNAQPAPFSPHLRTRTAP